MKKKAVIALWLGILVVCLCSPVLIAAWAVMTFLAWVNFRAYRQNRKQAAVFGAYSDVRNVNVLIIGDMIAPEVVGAGRSFVQVCAPGRGLRSCYEVLRHTHSILDDEGGDSCVVIALKAKNRGKMDFSVFDVPFFHRITVKKYGLERLCRLEKFPVIYEPLGIFAAAFGIKSRGWHEEGCFSPEIEKFCDERGYRVRFFA